MEQKLDTNGKRKKKWYDMLSIEIAKLFFLKTVAIHCLFLPALGYWLDRSYLFSANKQKGFAIYSFRRN